MGTKRAVQLTAEGREKFTTALNERWQAQFPGKRQTREARAEFLHLSIATSQKLLEGQPVDKSTIQLAFQRVGLPWNEEYCARQAKIERQPTSSRTSQAQDGGESRWRRNTLIALISAPVLATAVWLSVPRQNAAVTEPWRYELNRLLHQGTTEYQKGNYDNAEQNIRAALQIARQQDFAGACAENIRILGDIASARGDLNRARNHYLDALEIRQKSVKLNAGTEQPSLENTIPPLMEALGNVETRLKMWNEAREHFLVALRKYKEQNVPAGVAMAYRGLGTLTYKRGLFAESLTHFRSAFKSLEHKDIGSDLAFDIKARQALSLAELGQADMATDVLFACLRHWETSGHIRWQAETKLQLGVVALRRRRPDEASRYLTASLAEFQKVGDAENARHARELLANTRN